MHHIKYKPRGRGTSGPHPTTFPVRTDAYHDSGQSMKITDFFLQFHIDKHTLEPALDLKLIDWNIKLKKRKQKT